MERPDEIDGAAPKRARPEEAEEAEEAEEDAADDAEIERQIDETM